MRGVNVSSTDQKRHFFEGCPWRKFNNLGLELGMVLKFYTSVTKGLKLKVRIYWWLVPRFVEIKWKKLIGEAFLASPILNRVKLIGYTETFINKMKLFSYGSYYS